MNSFVLGDLELGVKSCIVLVVSMLYDTRIYTSLWSSFIEEEQ